MADTSVTKYTVLPKTCLDLWVESVGIPKLGDDVCEVLAEDVTYRIRESVHNALQMMKHCKRSCLKTDDFNHGLKQCNTELIYGHEGMDSVTFNSVAYKESRVCYVEEKEVNLREMALEPVYPADPGEISVKASWLVLEGHLCTSGKNREDPKTTLKEPISSYLTNVTSALIGRSDHLRKIALKDLMVNKKLQIVLPHLVSFFSSQFKQHTGKDSFSLVASYVLLAINALVENPSILLSPYVFQLVKIMLYVVTEAKMPVSKWHIKNKAAYVLAHLCRKENLTSQLIKSYQDSLSDNSRALSYIYGAVVGIKILGTKAVQNVLYPVATEKLRLFTEKCALAESGKEILELAMLKSALAKALALRYSSKHSSTECFPPKYGVGYAELYEDLGEEFLCHCAKANHQVPSNSSSKLASFTKSSAVNVSKSDTPAAQLIHKYCELSKSIDCLVKKSSEMIVSKIIIDDNVSLITSRRRHYPCASIFTHRKESEEKEEEEEEGVPRKKMKLSMNGIDRRKIIRAHPAYKRKQHLVKDLSAISCYLPVM